MRWASAIQGVIDSKVPIETPTQQLIRDIRVGTIMLIPLWQQTRLLSWGNKKVKET